VVTHWALTDEELIRLVADELFTQPNPLMQELLTRFLILTDPNQEQTHDRDHPDGG